MDNPTLPLQLLLAVAASFLIGLEMEGRKIGGKVFSPGGVRTFPLFALGGFLLAVLGRVAGPGNTGSPGSLGSLPFSVGLGVLGVWLAVLYRTKTLHDNYGLTTEAYAMVTYILGGLVAAELYWLVAALTVLMVLLQELRVPLERLAARLPGDELVTIAKFVLLSAVILPLMPDAKFALESGRIVQVSADQAAWQFGLNPRRIWLIVVAVTAVSHASYLLHQYAGRSSRGMLAVGLLGGAYSSTVTTIALARQSADPDQSAGTMASAGSILSASGVMNLRLLILIALFRPELAQRLLWPLGVAAVLGIAAGSAICLLGRRAEGPAMSAAEPTVKPPAEAAGPASSPPGPKDAAGAVADLPGPTAAPTPTPAFGPQASPLELRTAFSFAILFVIVLIVTHQVRVWLGGGGLLTLAGLTGLTDIDPFVMSLTQTPANWLGTATLAVVIGASANHLAKGVYAIVLGERRTGVTSLALLIGLAAVTLASWWLAVAAGVIPGLG